MFQRSVRGALPAALLTVGLALTAGAASGQDRPWQKLFGGFAPKTAAAPTNAAAARAAAEQQARRLAEIRVELAWLADPVTFPYFLDAKVEGGNLKVRGFVPDKAIRGQALKLARLYSPYPVADTLKEHPALLVRPGKMAPQQLHSAVVSALREALPRQVQRVQVQCAADGTVVLRGQLPSAEEKLAAALALRRLYGCTSVQTFIQVPGMPADPAPAAVARTNEPPPVKTAPEPAVVAKTPPPMADPDDEPDDPPPPRFGPPRPMKDRTKTAKAKTRPPAPKAEPKVEPEPAVASVPLPKLPEERPSAKIVSATPEPPVPPRLGGIETPAPDAKPLAGPSLFPPPNQEPLLPGDPPAKVVSSAKPLSPAILAKLQKRVAEACPGAKGVKVELLPKNKLKIELTVRTEAQIGTFTGSIYNIAELDDYRENVELHFILSEPPAKK